MSTFIIPVTSPLIQTDRSLGITCFTGDSRRANGWCKQPKNVSVAWNNKGFFRVSWGLSTKSPSLQTPSGGSGHHLEHRYCWADNETVDLILALKGFLLEVACVRFAHISLAKVSQLAITLTLKGVRKFCLLEGEKNQNICEHLYDCHPHIGLLILYHSARM